MQQAIVKLRPAWPVGSLLQPLSFPPQERLQAAWEGAAQAIHIIVGIDVVLRLLQELSQARLLLVQGALLGEAVLFQVPADPCHCGLMHEHIWHVSGLTRGILTCERSEAMLFQGSSWA